MEWHDLYSTEIFKLFENYNLVISVASPKEYWDLSGRLTLDGSVSTDCDSHSNNVIYSNTGRASVSPSFQIQYTEAPEQVDRDKYYGP